MSNPTDSPTKDNANLNGVNHATPIPILAACPHRRRSSTISSDGSPTTPPDLQTFTSYPTNLMPSSSSPPSSPIFSYFMSSPPKSASFPYRRLSGFGGPAVFEDDEGQEIEVRGPNHQRRATTGWASSRVASQKPAPAPPVIEAQQARGAGVLRRLSLGGGLRPSLQANTNSSSPPEPSAPPPSAVTPPMASGFAAKQPTPQRKVRRAATLNVPTSNARRRAPSPMGERILKGHFDGFN